MSKKDCAACTIPCFPQPRQLDDYTPLSDLDDELQDWTETKDPEHLLRLVQMFLTEKRFLAKADRLIDDWSIVKDFLDHDPELIGRICRRNAYALVCEGEIEEVLFHDLTDRTSELRPLFETKGFTLRVSADGAVWRVGDALAYHVSRS